MNTFEKNLQTNFAQNLRLLRKQKQLTMKQLGNHLKMSDVKISNFENEKNLPNLNDLAEIASFFEISIDVLVGFQKKQIKKPPIN